MEKCDGDAYGEDGKENNCKSKSRKGLPFAGLVSLVQPRIT